MMPAETVGTDQGRSTSTSRIPKPLTRWLSSTATARWTRLAAVLLLQLLPAVGHLAEGLPRALLAEDRLVELLAGEDVPDPPVLGEPLLDLGELRLLALQGDASPFVDRSTDLLVV